MFARVAIVGDGSRFNPYRPDVAGLVDQWQVSIQNDAAGHPLYTDCVVSVPDWKPTDKLARFMMSPAAADALLAKREPKIRVQDFKELAPALDLRAVVLFELFRDDFNRANNTDLGASWDAGYTTRMDLVSNRVRVSTTVSNESDETYTVALPANQWAQVTFPTWAADANTKYGWIMLRAAAPATVTWYQATIARNDGAFRTQISKKIAGVETSISSENSTTWAATDVLRLRVSETSLRLDRNGVSLLTGTDSSIAGSGRAGLGAYLGAGSAGDVEFDDFVCGGFGPLETLARGVCRGVAVGAR